MSAALSDTTVAALRVHGLEYLAPKFRAQVIAIRDAMAARGFPAVVFETLRLPRLQAHYHAVGASNAASVWHSWHGYGLACDFVHRDLLWSAPRAFWQALGAQAEALGCAWGGRWKSLPDSPHVQFGPGMRASPSNRARALVAQGGLVAVWTEVGAL
jgi:hypothetical protein